MPHAAIIEPSNADCTCLLDFKALYIAKGRGEADLGDRRLSQKPTSAVKRLTNCQDPDEEWHRGSSAGISADMGMRKSQPDRRATVSPHVESQYDSDARASVISRSSHHGEVRSLW